MTINVLMTATIFLRSSNILVLVIAAKIIFFFETESDFSFFNLQCGIYMFCISRWGILRGIGLFIFV